VSLGDRLDTLREPFPSATPILLGLT